MQPMASTHSIVSQSYHKLVEEEGEQETQTPDLQGKPQMLCRSGGKSGAESQAADQLTEEKEAAVSIQKAACDSFTSDAIEQSLLPCYWQLTDNNRKMR